MISGRRAFPGAGHARAWLGALFLIAASAVLGHQALPVHAETAIVVVTSAADSEFEAAECPSDGSCTLRKAIEFVNAIPGEEAATITFDPAVFPPADPVAIAILDTALPALTRPNTTVDGAGAGVVVDGSELQNGEDGLVLEGASSSVRGMTIVAFPGACLALMGLNGQAAGDPAAGTGNRVGDCGTGIRAGGAGTALRGNVVGFDRDGSTARAVRVGIEVTAASVTIGGTGIEPALANIVGHAEIAIMVGGDTGDPFSGVVVARNRIGESFAGAPAAIDRGVLIAPPAMAVQVLENTIGGASVSAVAVQDGSIRNTIRMNTFRPPAGLAIDLGDNSLADPNDPDDSDSGGNTRLNHPQITRPTQAAIQGTVCPGCRVDLYRVEHAPGGFGDVPVTPLISAIGDAGGAFTFNSPPVAPGEWIAATATDADGNTSEFSSPARIGAGAILCGNLALATGWNQAGYFGAGATVLGGTFPGDTRGRIRAVYHLNADGSYSRWFRDTTVGRTLTAVEPGLSYWFLVDEPVTLPAGFSLTAPLGIQLRAGWNEFVYFGASADGLDAFESLAAAGATVYRFEPGEDGGRWLRWGTSSSPAYVREFETVEACSSYTVFMEAAAVLRPLHP